MVPQVKPAPKADKIRLSDVYKRQIYCRSTGRAAISGKRLPAITCLPNAEGKYFLPELFFLLKFKEKGKDDYSR